MSLYPPCQYIRLMFKITVTTLAQYLKHISEMLEKQQHSFLQPSCLPGKAIPSRALICFCKTNIKSPPLEISTIDLVCVFSSILHRNWGNKNQSNNQGKEAQVKFNSYFFLPQMHKKADMLCINSSTPISQYCAASV